MKQSYKNAYKTYLFFMMSKCNSIYFLLITMKCLTNEFIENKLSNSKPYQTICSTNILQYTQFFPSLYTTVCL